VLPKVDDTVKCMPAKSPTQLMKQDSSSKLDSNMSLRSIGLDYSENVSESRIPVHPCGVVV